MIAFNTIINEVKEKEQYCEKAVIAPVAAQISKWSLFNWNMHHILIWLTLILFKKVFSSKRIGLSKMVQFLLLALLIIFIGGKLSPL